MFIRRFIPKLGIAVGMGAFVVGVAAVLIFDPPYRVWFSWSLISCRPFGLDPDKNYISADGYVIELEEYKFLLQRAENEQKPDH